MAHGSKKALSRKNAARSRIALRAERIKKSTCVGDLQGWLEKVEALGELRPVLGADWNRELGAISQINYRRPENPALLFDRIKDYPPGYRLLTSSMGSTRRLALAFRFSTDLDRRGLIEAFRGKPLQWEREAKNCNPNTVDSGPVFDEVQEGRDVNVLKFPTPIWHEKDGGRYIGTGCAVITRDIDSDWINLGAYRTMILDEKRVSIVIGQGKQGRMHYEKWWAKEGNVRWRSRSDTTRCCSRSPAWRFHWESASTTTPEP
jgi:UbiD family decarboxylase